MSSYIVKTKFNVECFGQDEVQTLYAKHDSITDLISFYDDNGELLFIVEKNTINNLMDAIKRLYSPCEENLYGRKLNDNIEYVSKEEFDKINEN